MSVALLPRAPTGQLTLAATPEVFVLPTRGQTPEQQSTQEVGCYGWAVQDTGSAPFDPARKYERAIHEGKRRV